MIKLALIGSGRWGNNYVTAIERLQCCKLAYVKNRDYRDLYSCEDIDGIIIATPAPTHFSIASNLLQKGFYNLLIEKPLTVSYDEGVALQEIAENKKAKIMVGHIQLFNPAYLKAKQELHRIGKVNYLDLVGANWGPFRTDISPLWDWAPHDLSLCIDLMKEIPKTVAGWEIAKRHPHKKYYDMVLIRLSFATDIYAIIKVGSLSPIKQRKMTVVGEGGAIVFDDLKKKKITLFNEKMEKSHPQYSAESPLERQVKSFAEYIQKDKKPLADLTHGVLTLKLLKAVEESIARESKEIEFSDRSV